MNKVTKRTYLVSFDVWEPFNKAVDAEMDTAIREIKKALQHVANLHITLSEEV